MSTRIRRITLAFILIFVATLSVLPAYAGAPVIPGFSFTGTTTCRDYLVVNYTYAGVTTSAKVEVYFGESLDPSISSSTTLSAPGGQVIFYLDSIIVTEGKSIQVQILAGGNTNSIFLTASGFCAPGVGADGNPEPQYLPCFNDGRLDPYNCAAPLALYLSYDDDGWMLQVWTIDEDGNGSFLFLLYSEDVSDIGGENIALLTKNGVTLYLLSTGEFQINAPYDELGKFYVLIFTIPLGEFTRADFSVQE